jgi:malonyl CoA-acyl carrier protein transacylase
MSSAILSLLISHVLTFVESELVKEEPQLVALVVQDIQSLIAKLESMISAKSRNAAAIAVPLLNLAQSAAVSAVEAAGQSVAQDIAPSA